MLYLSNPTPFWWFLVSQTANHVIKSSIYVLFGFKIHSHLIDDLLDIKWGKKCIGNLTHIWTHPVVRDKQTMMPISYISVTSSGKMEGNSVRPALRQSTTPLVQLHFLGQEATDEHLSLCCSALWPSYWNIYQSMKYISTLPENSNTKAVNFI